MQRGDGHTHEEMTRGEAELHLKVETGPHLRCETVRRDGSEEGVQLGRGVRRTEHARPRGDAKTLAASDEQKKKEIADLGVPPGRQGRWGFGGAAPVGPSPCPRPCTRPPFPLRVANEKAKKRKKEKK